MATQVSIRQLPPVQKLSPAPILALSCRIYSGEPCRSEAMLSAHVMRCIL